jgi:hypothetical protein
MSRVILGLCDLGEVVGLSMREVTIRDLASCYLCRIGTQITSLLNKLPPIFDNRTAK